MPFEFNGEAPPLGSTSDAFTPFSFAASPTANSARPPTFGGVASFGSTPTLSRSSSFATSFSVPQSSQTTTPGEAASPIEHAADQSSSQHIAAPHQPKDDLLSRSLHRTKHRRSAIFGADIAADDVISTYLEMMQREEDVGEAQCLDKLETTLSEIAEARPGAMRFLHHVFKRAATSNTKINRFLPIESEYREEAGNIPSEAPDVYTDIYPGTRLYKACQTAINNRMRGASYYHYNSYYEIGSDVTNLIADGAPRAVVRQFLSTGAYGAFTPSTNLRGDVDEFVDEMYEIVLTVKKQFKNGWKVKGRDEASYFGKGFGDEKPEIPFQFWDEDRKEKNPSALCCPRKPDEVEEESLPQSTDDKPFRFLDLPPELRNQIYRKVLAPGMVSLLSCRHHNPRGTTPGLVPGILVTCKQVQQEAADLLFENTFLVAFCPDFMSVRRSALHRAQLPLHVLSKITSLVLVVDCIRFRDIHSDLTAFQALTSLKTLRIIAIEEEAQQHVIPVASLSVVLQEIVTRIPASCDVYYGSRPGRETSFTIHMLDVLSTKWVDHVGDHPVEEVRETDVAKLREAADNVPDDVVRGSKSGEAPTSRSLPGDLRGLPTTKA